MEIQMVAIEKFPPEVEDRNVVRIESENEAFIVINRRLYKITPAVPLNIPWLRKKDPALDDALCQASKFMAKHDPLNYCMFSRLVCQASRGSKLIFNVADDLGEERRVGMEVE